MVYEFQKLIRVLTTQHTMYTGLRMADFGNFAVALGRADGDEDRMRGILDRLSRQQSVFGRTEHWLVRVIRKWLDIDNGKNRQREVQVRDLVEELGELAQRDGVEFPPWKKKDSAKSLRARAKIT